MLKREPWSIANAFAYGIRILNAMFCSDNKDEQEYSPEEMSLVAEQINSMCSRMMIEDAELIIGMILSTPKDRLCERTDCRYHHPDDYRKHDFNIFQDKCDECIHNQKCKLDESSRMDHLES